MRCFVLILLATLSCPPLLAQQEATPEQLEALRDELKSLRKELDRAQGKYAEVQKQLEREELELARLHKRMSSTERSIATSRDVLAELERERDALAEQRAAQEERIRRELRALYRSGPKEPIKLLLNMEDPAEFSRMLIYYRELTEARRDKIESYRTTIEEIEQNRLARQEEKARMEDLLARLDEQEARLEKGHEQRQATLAELNARIANTEEEIEQKEADRRQLENLINSLATRMAEMRMPSKATPFKEIRGDCNWPTQGRIVADFGSQRTGSLDWKGVVINADDGASVQAVHHGRVMFADYMRGYGLLVIIDHDDEYLTLYGHNQYLYVEPGDWVEAGGEIARVGDTGGQQDTGLYFEIRQGGQPTDPADWCG